MNSKNLTVGVIEFTAGVLARMVANDSAFDGGVARACERYRIVDGFKLCYLEDIWDDNGIVSIVLSYGPDRWTLTVGADESVWVA